MFLLCLIFHRYFSIQCCCSDTDLDRVRKDATRTTGGAAVRRGYDSKDHARRVKDAPSKGLIPRGIAEGDVRMSSKDCLTYLIDILGNLWAAYQSAPDLLLTALKGGGDDGGEFLSTLLSISESCGEWIGMDHVDGDALNGSFDGPNCVENIQSLAGMLSERIIDEMDQVGNDDNDDDDEPTGPSHKDNL